MLNKFGSVPGLRYALPATRVPEEQALPGDEQRGAPYVVSKEAVCGPPDVSWLVGSAVTGC